jgi:hypothetical protein
MGQANSEAAASLAEDKAQAAESVQVSMAAVVTGQEEEDTAVRHGAPCLDAGAAEAASVDQGKGFRRRATSQGSRYMLTRAPPESPDDIGSQSGIT